MQVQPSEKDIKGIRYIYERVHGTSITSEVAKARMSSEEYEKAWARVLKAAGYALPASSDDVRYVLQSLQEVQACFAAERAHELLGA